MLGHRQARSCCVGEPRRSIAGGRGLARRPPKRLRLSTRAVSQPLGEGTLEAAAEATACPYTAFKRQLRGVLGGPAEAAPSGVVTPGPAAFSLASLGDVGCIFTDGIHQAMLRFEEKYGPVSRCAQGARETSLAAGAGGAAKNSDGHLPGTQCAANVVSH